MLSSMLDNVYIPVCNNNPQSLKLSAATASVGIGGACWDCVMIIAEALYDTKTNKKTKNYINISLGHRYSYDDQSQREVCIVEYPESPAFTPITVGQGEDMDTHEAPEARDPTPPTKLLTPPSTAESAPSPEKKSKKKPFHCKPCNFQAKTESEFVEHLQTHAVSKMIVVNKVEGRSHKGKEAEASHEEPEKTNQSAAGGEIKGLIRCERCGYNTNRYDHYISHLKHHSKDQDHRVFKCTLCPYTTVSQYHWRKHLRNHFPSKLHTCSQCSYFSDRKSNYIQHIRTHTGVRPFQCPYCDYSSSQKTHLTRHMRTHSGERPFKCETCNYLAANQHEVTRHARQVHNGPKPLACPYCDYKTADRSNFKKHVELHLNPRQFNCPLCKYAASKKCNLQYHIKSRHAGCDVNLDISKVKLRVKKADSESRGDRSPASPINLSIKNKKPQEEAKKSGDNGRDVDKKLKQKKMEDFVKAVERMTPKKRSKKADKVQDKSEQKEQERAKMEEGKGAQKKDKKEEERAKMEDGKGALKKDKKEEERAKMEDGKGALKKDKKEEEEKAKMEDGKGVPKKDKKKEEERAKMEDGKSAVKMDKKANKMANIKVVKKAKTSKRKAAEVLDLSQKVESPAKIKKVREAEEKPKRKKSKKGGDNPTEQDQEVQKEIKGSSAVNGHLLESRIIIGDQEAAPEVVQNMPEKMEVVSEELSKEVSKSDTTVLSENVCQSLPEKTTEEVAGLMEQSNKKIQENGEKIDLEIVNKSQKKGEKSPKKSTKKKGVLVEDVASKLALNKESEMVLNCEKAAQAEVEPVEKPTQTVSELDTEPTTSEECSPRSEKVQSPPQTPSPSREVFVKPSGRPPLFLQRQASSSSSSSTKPVESEEDEGIHEGLHEGASDASDSASECSDDSGLKMLTPTDDMPTPTELKAHLCIFCDRTFPFKSDYQRHLNRHLVNVYYMDHSKANK
uniref:C2H2-type domain-containing protein n=1 Tax=Periophthalmus magnuspinnatus TaxID=409849 RepID=A0A3B4B0K2_9GOBI